MEGTVEKGRLLIVINARFLTQNISGVQRYAIEICRELKKMHLDIILVAPKNIIHEGLVNELGVTLYGKFTGHLWEQIELPLFLKSRGNPLLVNMANTAPIYFKNKITVVHDIAFERFPQSFSWKFRFFYRRFIPEIIATSISVVTVSEFSKFEILELYGAETNEIEVVCNAVSNIFKPSLVKIDEKYMLAVSSLNYQKNFHSLIKAFNCLSLSTPIKLFLVGAINKNFADHSLISDIEANPNIVFLGRVDDDELVALYSNAECFVYPSLYEGFGIPPLEAQACGCPCLVSNVASLPEVCADSVVYCNPYEISDIAQKLDFILSNKSIRNDLVGRGFKNIKRFSWKKSAQQMLQIIEKNL